MKRALLCLSVAFLFSIAASAQINKGSILLGGSLSGSTFRYKDGTNDNKSSGVIFNPAVGLFFRNNMAAGVNLRVGAYTTESNNNTLSEENNDFGAGFFLRRYHALGKSFFLFGEGSVYYSRSNAARKSPPAIFETTDKRSSVGLNIYPGIVYALSRRFHLEVGLNGIAGVEYSKRTTTTNNNGTISAATTNGFTFSTNASNSIPLNIGFRFLIGK